MEAIPEYAFKNSGILIASALALCGLVSAASAGLPIGRGTRLPFGPFLALGLHGALAAACLAH